MVDYPSPLVTVNLTAAVTAASDKIAAATSRGYRHVALIIFVTQITAEIIADLWTQLPCISYYC